MPASKKNYKLRYLFGALGLLLILILGTILAYSTNIKLLQKIYPAFVVGNRFITLQAWQEHQAVAAKLDSSFSQQAVFDQMIKISEERQLVDSLHIPVNAKDFNQELIFLKAVKDNQYNQILNKYFDNDARIFNDEVMAPRVYDKLLKIQYNSDFNVNSSAYSRTQDLLAQIKAGKKFEDLAVTSSDDKITGQLGGDLGFVSLDQVLPELADKIPGLKIGEVSERIAVSRLGYEIMYPVETSQKDLPAEASAKAGGQTLYHVKLILIQTTGFDNWLMPQLAKFSVWRIVKP